MDKAMSPLVPGSTGRLIRTFPTGKLINDWQATFGLDISDEMRDIESIFLYRCQASGLDFFLPPEAAGSEKIYQGLQKYAWFYMASKWEFIQALKDLRGAHNILEVGSGPGHFLAQAVNELPGIRIRGIEFNEAALREAWHRNLPVEQRRLEEIAATEEKFDAVCSFQVLEHVSHPRLFLEAMVHVLSWGGRLILSVPNRESFLKHQHNLLDLPPHHMTRWNAFAFKYMEKLFPLKIVRILYEPLAQYHISGYLSAYAQFWSRRLSFLRYFARERQIYTLAGLLERSGLYHFLHGQGMYIVFKKI
jgi:SAM-dependent methyltransferase